jgi:hypothetical protein
MIVMHEKVILPTRMEWITVLLVVGFSGFFAQVRRIIENAHPDVKFPHSGTTNHGSSA